jgi:hypothetical protein
MVEYSGVQNTVATLYYCCRAVATVQVATVGSTRYNTCGTVLLSLTRSFSVKYLYISSHIAGEAFEGHLWEDYDLRATRALH